MGSKTLSLYTAIPTNLVYELYIKNNTAGIIKSF